jgi:ABC transporter substrate binding protein (PQQ-dependent alcohol dehydrogenase system)
MVSDALAQYLAARAWRGVLLLEGPEAEDARRAAALVASFRKFGIKVIEHRPFTLSNDPRQRERNNITLLTLAGNYDAVFVADSLGEFGRYVPFQTARPRPVLGDAGLGAFAWHWAWERHGAPQLNQRFDRIAKRRMTGVDWAAWAATRALIEAVARTKSTGFAAVAAYLKSPDLSLDGYKGTPMSFRPWDGQLRQPILLAGHDAVIGRAPLEGFLHPTSYLDTLGADEPESKCRM